MWFKLLFIIMCLPYIILILIYSNSNTLKTGFLNYKNKNNIHQQFEMYRNTFL